MWKILFLKLITCAYAERSDGVYPQNLAVIAGEPMSFLCGHPSEQETVIWKVRKIGSVEEDQISSGNSNTGEYSAEQFTIGLSPTVTEHSLLKKNYTGLHDAGSYKCIRTDQNKTVIGIGSAQLIVLDSEPKCRASANTIEEGDYLRVSCILKYRGSLSPVTNCSGIDGIHSHTRTSVTSHGNTSVFTKQLSSVDNGRNISCTTYFEPLTSSDNRTDAQKADNAPEFKHNWIYITNVLFQPKSVGFDPRKESYVIGEIIRCKANGNPTPVYSWKEAESKAVVSNNSTLVVNNVTMKDRTYECTATNIRGSNSSSITIRISEGHPTRGIDFMYAVTVVAGVLCAVLMIVVIAITIKRIKESCQSSTNREFATGPDIVQHAEDFDPILNERPFDGYARAEDFDTVHAPCCANGAIQNGIPIYDEIKTEVKESNTQSDKPGQEYPVYGKVNKPPSHGDAKYATNSAPEEYPAYGKVQKKASDKIQEFEESCVASLPVSKTEEAEEIKAPENLYETSTTHRRVIVGADGTEYMDMSTVRSLVRSENQTESSIQSPQFVASEYAEIDHSGTT